MKHRRKKSKPRPKDGNQKAKECVHDRNKESWRESMRSEVLYRRRLENERLRIENERLRLENENVKRKDKRADEKLQLRKRITTHRIRVISYLAFAFVLILLVSGVTESSFLESFSVDSEVAIIGGTAVGVLYVIIKIIDML